MCFSCIIAIAIPLFLSAIALPLMVDGQTQPSDSSCSNIQLQVKVQRGKYEPINNNITIYRRFKTKGFTMRCQCTNSENEIPMWSLPSDDLLKCKEGKVCPMNTLSFQQLKKKHSGYYKCHINSISMGFNLLVVG